MDKRLARIRVWLQPRRHDQGFTLIEALVALAVMAAGVAAIGQLGFSTLSAARRAETRLSLTAAARKTFASLVDRRNLRDGAQSGQADGSAWRLRASPFAFDAPGAPGPVIWSPQAVRLTVTGSTGGEIVIDTVRLRPTGGSP